MIRAAVTVRTLTERLTYIAIGSSSADIAEAAFDKFGICSITVMVQP